MAGPNERRNFDRREDNSTGHSVKWDLTVGDLAHLTTRPFRKTYRTLCETSPTTWRFDMSLPEVRDDGTCSLHVLLERTDFLHNVEIESSIWIDIYDPRNNLIFRKQTFTRSGMLPGNMINQTNEMIPLPNMRDRIHRNPKVCVTLTISFCHSDGDLN